MSAKFETQAKLKKILNIIYFVNIEKILTK